MPSAIARARGSSLPALALLLLFLACERDTLETEDNVMLRLSTDTVTFDTVFTQRSTVFQSFKIFNPSESAILIDRIFLDQRGQQGVDYRLNIDGVAGDEVNDYRIEAEDSLFVFVEATVDPTNDNQPFVTTEYVVVENGSYRDEVVLEAFGQNAIYHIQDTIRQNTTWTDELPHLVYGALFVLPEAELRIEPGTRVFMHAGALMAVLGRLRIEGTAEAPVKIQGDRLGAFYRDRVGQWQGIFLLSPSDANVIRHADIRNGVFGLRVDSLGRGFEPKLRLENTRITNMEQTALSAFTGEIVATNCELSNGCEGVFAADLGGQYRFRHVTMAHFPTQCGSGNPAVSMVEQNFRVDSLGINQPFNLEAEFVNCVIEGREREQIAIRDLGDGRVAVAFEHSALRTQQAGALDTQACLINRDTLFAGVNEPDFRPDSLSPLLGAGKALEAVPQDLEGAPRDAEAPTIGAYEKP